MTKNCPSCGIEWEQKETIYEYFFSVYKDETKARKAAQLHGCTPDNPKHFGKNVIGIENGEYDGVSLWECQECKSQFSRWTMEKL